MHFLLFLGSVRDSTPPRPARLGLGVCNALLNAFAARCPGHKIELIDALDIPLEPVFKPHFSYPENRAPEALNQLAGKIAAADGYIMLSPEYNHSMSPALANLLNHFGSSLYAYKPSVIATYSAGQWGGMRAAVNMRTFLAELGCLPVSAMIHVATVQDHFAQDGSPLDGVDEGRWFDYFGRAFEQLIWWSAAARQQRERTDPHGRIGDFVRDPSQRNAP